MYATKYTGRGFCVMNEREKELENALLWIIYEQCAYNGKLYAWLLIHGAEAFAALGLSDGCPVEDVEKRLFERG